MTTPAVNKTKITIKKGTDVYLFLDTNYVGTTVCTKAGIYTVDPVTNAGNPNIISFYSSTLPQSRTHDHMVYDMWLVAVEDVVRVKYGTSIQP